MFELEILLFKILNEITRNHEGCKNSREEEVANALTCNHSFPVDAKGLGTRQSYG